jgi:hypothetical protein
VAHINDIAVAAGPDRREKRDKREKRKTPESVATLWTRALEFQARESNKTLHDLVSDLLNLRGEMSAGEPEHFDEEQFDKLPKILRALLLSKVLAAGNKGKGFVAAEQWVPWNAFLFSQSIQPPRGKEFGSSILRPVA